MIRKDYLMDEWRDFDIPSRNHSLTTVAWSMPSVCASPTHIIAERLASDYGEAFAGSISTSSLSKYYSEAVEWYQLYKKNEIYELVLDVIQRAQKENIL